MSISKMFYVFKVKIILILTFDYAPLIFIANIVDIVLGSNQ